MTILKEVSISQVMSRDILTVKADESILEVSQKMSKINVGSAIVVDKSIIGIVTERDFLHSMSKEGVGFSELPISQVMTKDVLCIDINEALEVAGNIMGSNRFRHLPVTENGLIVGILSARDIFKAFHNHDIIKIKQLEAVKALAITYAHEINNPLTIISGSLRILKKEFEHEKLETAKENVKRITQVIKKITDIDDISLNDYSEESRTFCLGKKEVI